MKSLVSLLLLLGGGFSPSAQMPQDCLSYDPATVMLKGKLSRNTFAGPPNYESVKKGDAPETYWILHLARPICVSGDEPEKNVSDIQLFLSEEQYARHKDLLGKRVVVSGKLWHANMGHHHTSVLLNVAEIKGARR